jgi:hypothetical protein
MMIIVYLILILLGLAALGLALSVGLIILAAIFWLATIPLRLLGIMPGVWWGND